MKKKIINIIVSIIVIAALLLCGIWLSQKNKSTNADDQTIEIVMKNNTTIEIKNVRSASDDSFVANVEITMPDILAIYKYLQSEGKTDGMTLSDICTAISEYAKDTKYLTRHNISAPVRKEEKNWVLTSTDCVDEIIRETTNKLLVQVVNEIGTMDIGEEDEFVWEEKQ